MLYSYVVKKLVRESFENVNNHRYDELLQAVAPNVHHRFAGAHSIGGERHDKEAMRRWLERLGRVLPNLHIKVNDLWVKGGPWKCSGRRRLHCSMAMPRTSTAGSMSSPCDGAKSI